MIKRSFFFCICFALLGFIGSTDRVFGQPQSEPKIAFVNSQAFVEGITELRQQVEALDKEFKPTMDQLKSMAEQIQLDEEVLKRTINDLNPEARQRKLEDLEKAKKDYQRKLEDAKETYGKRQDVLVSPLREKITKALNTYAQQRGVDLVLDIATAIQSGTVAYIAPGVDITEDFVKSYNQANPGKK